MRNRVEDLYKEIIGCLGVGDPIYYFDAPKFLINDEKVLKQILEWAYVTGYEGVLPLKGNRVSVDRYDESGEFAQSYASISSAAKDIGVSQSTLSEALSKGIRCGGQYWVRQGQVFSKKSLDAKRRYRVQKGYDKISKPVEKLSMHRVCVSEYRSLSKASIMEGISRDTLLRVIKGAVYYKGYFWRYKEKV